MTRPAWSVDSSEVWASYGPGGILRCWCGHRVEDLSPATYATVRVLPSGSTGLSRWSHCGIMCSQCKSVLEITYQLRGDLVA